MTRIQRDTIVYVCIALGSIALLIWVIPAYTPPYPGYGASPALVPNVAVGIVLVMSILALVRNGLAYRQGKARSPHESEFPDELEAEGFSQVGRIKLWHLARLIVPCAVLIPLMDWIGFVPAGIAFMMVIQYVVGRREPIRSIILSVVVVLLIYAAMRYGFKVPVPGA